MKRFVIILTILLFVILTFTVSADVPERKEQFVYSIVAFDGDQYSGTFCREESNEIYLLAGQENFITPQKTFVYYWPITKEWRTDTQTFQHVFEGNLEISGNNIETQKVSKKKYTYYVVKGEYTNILKIATGEEADEIMEYYRKQVSDYYDAVSTFNEEKKAYEDGLMEIAGRIQKMREAGEDVTELRESVLSMEAPVQPKPPDEFVSPPTSVREAFIIDLPEGEYQIQFYTEDGKLMQNSTKKLLVFNKNRTKGIGYEILPGDKWTRPEESKTPSSVIYVDGTTEIFLRPFFEDEYNDHFYKRLIDNNDAGNPNIMSWKRSEQIPKATIQVFSGSGGDPDAVLTEEPYYVEQTKGSALGYNIVPYEPEGKHKDRDPSLIAFHLPIRGTNESMTLKVLDREGELLKGSERKFRIIKKDTFNFLLLGIVFIPIPVMIVIAIRRQRKYSD